VLTTVADARRRLLAPDAAIIPCAAAVFALPIELRVGERVTSRPPLPTHTPRPCPHRL